MLLKYGLEHRVLREHALNDLGVTGVLPLELIDGVRRFGADEPLGHEYIFIVDAECLLFLALVIETAPVKFWRKLHLGLAVVAAAIDVNVVQPLLKHYVLAVDFGDVLAQLKQLRGQLVLHKDPLSLLDLGVNVEAVAALLVQTLPLQARKTLEFCRFLRFHFFQVF